MVHTHRPPRRALYTGGGGSVSIGPELGKVSARLELREGQLTAAGGVSGGLGRWQRYRQGTRSPPPVKAKCNGPLGGGA